MNEQQKAKALEAVTDMISAIKEDHGDEFPSDYTFKVLGSVLYDHLETIRQCLAPVSDEATKSAIEELYDYSEEYGCAGMKKHIDILNAALTTPSMTWSDGYKAAQNTIMRRNSSGCCCKWTEDEKEIVSMCEAHKAIINKPSMEDELAEALENCVAVLERTTDEVLVQDAIDCGDKVLAKYREKKK